MFWRRNKNKNNEYYDIIGLAKTGNLSLSASNDYFLIFGRAILCLLLTVGSICGYASCFGAQFNLWLILGILSLSSLIIAFFKNLKSNLWKNFFYLAFLFTFGFTIFRFYKYVNSGYHALVNLTYASLENYLDIPALVYYEEIIESSYHTITLFLIFLGIFELFIYHIQISEHFSAIKIFLLSFGPFIVPLFINLIPEDFYIICLMTAYIAGIILRLCLHSCKPRKNEKYTVYKKTSPWSGKIKGFSYGTNGITYFFSICFSFIISILIFAIVTITIPYASYQREEKISSLKESITDEVKYFVTFGLSGLFNRYNATGGLNDGKLGGIYSVRPDYETDLTVRYVPLSGEPVYLRGFIGTAYADRQWYNSDTLFEDKFIDETFYKKMCEYDSLVSEYMYINQNYPGSTNCMQITNVGANPKYSYSPYYTNPEQLEIYGAYAETPYRFLLNRTKTYNFYPYYENYMDSIYPVVSGYYDFHYAPYLQIPSDTREEIVEFLVENNLCTDYITTNSSYSQLSGEKLDLIISQVSESLSTDFVYSLNPGITPKNEDFVGYFLNENRKGFCAHFATSATLILRTLGIPARYVEGYVITSDNLQNAQIVEDAILSDYMDTSIINRDFSIVDVNIADDKAHAWVEYYDPEFGWRVFEATTASMEDASGYDFWSSLYGFLNNTSESPNDLDVNNSEMIDSSTVADILYRLLIIILTIVLLGITIFYLYYGIKQYRSYHRSRNNINVRNYYKIICRKICKTYPEFDFIISVSGQLDFIIEHYKVSKSFLSKDITSLASILERSAFSKVDLTYSEYQYSMKMLKILRKNITFKF